MLYPLSLEPLAFPSMPWACPAFGVPVLFSLVMACARALITLILYLLPPPLDNSVIMGLSILIRLIISPLICPSAEWAPGIMLRE